jgi:hypothetical protein
MDNIGKFDSFMIMSRIGYIKYKLHRNMISYDEAKEKAAPLINELNIRASKVAKKHGKKAVKFSFTKMMR